MWNYQGKRLTSSPTDLAIWFRSEGPFSRARHKTLILPYILTTHLPLPPTHRFCSLYTSIHPCIHIPYILSSSHNHINSYICIFSFLNTHAHSHTWRHFPLCIISLIYLHTLATLMFSFMYIHTHSNVHTQHPTPLITLIHSCTLQTCSLTLTGPLSHLCHINSFKASHNASDYTPFAYTLFSEWVFAYDILSFQNIFTFVLKCCRSF